MEIPKELGKFDSLVEIIEKLRSPEGCPWDREQTHSSLRESFLQECYEVLEAIDAAEPAMLREELGDLMLHIVMQVQIASENGEFTLSNVIKDINEKIIRRHPHVFGEQEVNGTDEIIQNWEALKKQEKGEDVSILKSVPRQMPSLGYSQEVQHRVAQVGFDWEEDEGVIEKLAEEVSEFKQAESVEEKQREFGDMLFTLANLARRQGIDLESALREANRKFYRRFTRMEQLCQQRGVTVADLSFDEQNALWDKVKEELK